MGGLWHCYTHITHHHPWFTIPYQQPQRLETGPAQQPLILPAELAQQSGLHVPLHLDNLHLRSVVVMPIMVIWPICHMLHIMGNNGEIMVYLPTKLDDFVRANVGKYSIHGVDMGWVVVDMICKKICNTWDLDRNQSHQGWDKHQHGEFKQHISDILRMSHVI